MRFGKLKIFVGISLVVFFLVVANTIAFGLMAKNQDTQLTNNNLIYDNKNNNAVVDKSNLTISPIITQPAQDNSPVAQQPADVQPVIQQPAPVVIQQRTRTRAS